MLLNTEQEFVVQEAIKWFHTPGDMLFQYDGPPGTGKSVVLNEIVKRLELDITTEIAPMSFIGAASLVMRVKGLYSAKTAHSWCYDVVKVIKYDKDGNVMKDKKGRTMYTRKFVPKSSLGDTIRLIIIDEAYCMPRSMRAVIEKFGIKVLACGDQKQLPPVGDSPAYLIDGKIYHLTQIMRQMGIEDIIFIANRAMHQMPLLPGYYGHSMVIDRDNLSDSILLWADVIICCTNRTREIINNHIRYLKGYKGQLPNFGERIVCRSNDWETCEIDSFGNIINPVNGLLGTVTNSPGVDTYIDEDRTFILSFTPDLAKDCNFLIEANYDYMIAKDANVRKEIKNNARTVGNCIEFAYAITCHISQGSQFNKVIYIEESMGSHIQGCLNLVGPTRATRQLIYVRNNFKPWQTYPEETNKPAHVNYGYDKQYRSPKSFNNN